MLYFPNISEHDPRINLAIETYLLRQKVVHEPIIFFYINEPSVIIGRNQNTHAEINHEFINEHKIKVVRRMSGGGAVYHDFGNLNFSFITPDSGRELRDFQTLTQPIVDSLHALGATRAKLSGRNDLLIGEQKFSGNASYATGGRMFSHGTLLFDSDLAKVGQALKPRPEKFISKSTRSVRARVTNIKPHLATDYQQLSTAEFRDCLVQQLFNVNDLQAVPKLTLDKKAWQEIYLIAKKQYDNWDWNYGVSPKFSVEKLRKFPFGLLEVGLDVTDGKISDLKIYGDFFGRRDVSELAELLVGTTYHERALHEVLQSVNFADYFGELSVDTFTEFLL